MSAVMAIMGFVPAWAANATPMRPAILTAQTTTACHAADWQSDDLLAYVRTLVTSSDSETVAFRTTIGLPAVDSAHVVLATNAADAALCEEARAAFIPHFKADTLQIPTVYVVTIGPTRYLVTDLQSHVGEYTALYVFDEHFSLLGAIAR
jgi:hypothetical protein